jgi:hypothetical protein
MIPILHAPGVIIPGQFGPMSRLFFGHNPDLARARRDNSGTIWADEPALLPGHLRFHPHHVHHRNSFRDADHQFHAGIDRLQNSIGRACRGHENY